MAKENLWEQLMSGIGNGISDVREKVEEAMWGRAVTHESQQPAEVSQEPEQAGLGSKTSVRHFSPALESWPEARESHTERLRDDRSKDQELDIDR